MQIIDQASAARALAAAVATGGDFAEIFAEDRDSGVYTMLDGMVESVTAAREHGAGIRVLQGVRSIYAYTNDLSENGLFEAAKAVSAAVKGETRSVSVSFDPARGSLENKVLIPHASVGESEKLALLRRANLAAKGQSITQVKVWLAETEQRVTVANTEGLWASDCRVRTRFGAQAVASEGGEAQTGHEAPGYSMGYELFEFVDVEGTARKAADSARTMLSAPLCPAGRFPVVIDGGFGGVIFHEACAHSLEATSVSKGNSVFCGKLGQKIAASCVTAVDDGTLIGEWGYIAMDDEGMPARRNVLIENGVLNGYLIDRLGARRMNMHPTGSARRQGYAFAPTSRMTNTFIEAGKDDEDKIIASVSEGLYAKTMGGGSVNPLTGEFNFAVREGYWIKNGVIERPVRGATLIGKGADILMNIDRIGKRSWLGAGVCGSASGSVPTCVGQPMIRVSEMTVGGKGDGR